MVGIYLRTAGNVEESGRALMILMLMMIFFKNLNLIQHGPEDLYLFIFGKTDGNDW